MHCNVLNINNINNYFITKYYILNMNKELNENQVLSAIRALRLLDPQIINGGNYSDEEDDKEFEEDNLEDNSSEVADTR